MSRSASSRTGSRSSRSSRSPRPPRPLAGLTVSLIGPGRVGSSLALWAVERGAELVAVGAPPGSESARELAGRFDAVAVPWERLGTRDEDLLLVAVPDPALEGVAQKLARRAQSPVVLHTSGRHGAEVLAPLRAKGSAVGTLHPLRAFPRPSRDPAEAAETVFGVAGDPEAVEIARRLAHAWGSHPMDVPEESRAVYHLAATLAAGGVVTLLATAAELAVRAGLPARALDGYFALARGALEQAFFTANLREESEPENLTPGQARRQGVAAAVTGPVARGDRQTVTAELDALRELAPEIEPLVLELALEGLRRRADLPVRESSREAARKLAEALEERRALC